MKIKFLNGIYSGRELEFNTPSVTIGRDGGNQLILDTDGVSRCHAELKQLPDGSWQVQDLNSTNGVKINGVRIDGPAPVTEGVELTVGENHLLITALSQEPAPVIFNPIISPGVTAEPSEPDPEIPVLKVATPAASAESAWDPKKLTGSLFGKKENKKDSGEAPARVHHAGVCGDHDREFCFFCHVPQKTDQFHCPCAASCGAV